MSFALVNWNLWPCEVGHYLLIHSQLRNKFILSENSWSYLKQSAGVKLVKRDIMQVKSEMQFEGDV